MTPTKLGPFRWESSCGNTFPGDFWHSVRENFAALTTSMRQIGVGTPGGAEALANFHQLIYDEWTTGSLIGPLARIKVDENSGFGMIGWKAVHEAASRFLPMHAAAAPWKHRNVSFVEQEGLSPMPKGQGAEQGDVDGPLECGLALGMVAAEAGGSIAARQVAGTLPWLGVTTMRSGSGPSNGSSWVSRRTA